MIAAISLMQRRPDISLAKFRKHWLDPHGVMTAALPGLRHYIQSHCIASPVTNALAEHLGIEGIPELWFDSIEDRRMAYTSPRIAECNIDSEQFVGAVTRLVTEPVVVIPPPAVTKPVKVILLATGAPDVGWADRAEARIARLPDITGYIRQMVLEQTAAANSRIAELKVPVAGLAEVTFASEAALADSADALAGAGSDAGRTAIYRVEDSNFI